MIQERHVPWLLLLLGAVALAVGYHLIGTDESQLTLDPAELVRIQKESERQDLRARQIERLGPSLKEDERYEGVLDALTAYRFAARPSAAELPEDLAHDRVMAVSDLAALLAKDDGSDPMRKTATDEIAARLLELYEQEPDAAVRLSIVEALAEGRSGSVARGLWKAQDDVAAGIQEEARDQIEWFFENRNLRDSPARAVLLQLVRDGLSATSEGQRRHAEAWSSWLTSEGLGGQ